MCCTFFNIFIFIYINSGRKKHEKKEEFRILGISDKPIDILSKSLLSATSLHTPIPNAGSHVSEVSQNLYDQIRIVPSNLKGVIKIYFWKRDF